MLRRSALVLVLASFLGGFAPPPVSRDGIYGQICLSGETGDIGGLKVEVSTKGRPQATFLLCEGWCEPEDVKRVPATIAGDQISFDIIDEHFEDGKQVRKRVHLTGRFTKDALVLDGKPGQFFDEPHILKRKGRCGHGGSPSPYPWDVAKKQAKQPLSSR